MAITQVLFPYYKPVVRNIASITNAVQALITTEIEHMYISGIIARIYLPLNFSMQQINGLYAPITVTSPTQFLISIDTTNFDVFAFPPNYICPGGLSLQAQYAQVVPIAEINSQLTAAVQNVLPYP